MTKKSEIPHTRRKVPDFGKQEETLEETKIRNSEYYDMQLALLYHLMNNPCGKQSVEYNDNRIALYVAQKGKCAVSGVELEANQVDCHHKKPLVLGGNDSYQNLIIVSDVVHILIHSSNERTIRKYLKVLNLDKKQLAKLNKLRVLAEMPELVF